MSVRSRIESRARSRKGSGTTIGGSHVPAYGGSAERRIEVLEQAVLALHAALVELARQVDDVDDDLRRKIRRAA